MSEDPDDPNPVGGVPAAASSNPDRKVDDLASISGDAGRRSTTGSFTLSAKDGVTGERRNTEPPGTSSLRHGHDEALQTLQARHMEVYDESALETNCASLSGSDSDEDEDEDEGEDEGEDEDEDEDETPITQQPASSDQPDLLPRSQEKVATSNEKLTASDVSAEKAPVLPMNLEASKPGPEPELDSDLQQNPEPEPEPEEPELEPEQVSAQAPVPVLVPKPDLEVKPEPNPYLPLSPQSGAAPAAASPAPPSTETSAAPAAAATAAAAADTLPTPVNPEAKESLSPPAPRPSLINEGEAVVSMTSFVSVYLLLEILQELDAPPIVWEVGDLFDALRDTFLELAGLHPAEVPTNLVSCYIVHSETLEHSTAKRLRSLGFQLIASGETNVTTQLFKSAGAFRANDSNPTRPHHVVLAGLEHSYRIPLDCILDQSNDMGLNIWLCDKRTTLGSLYGPWLGRTDCVREIPLTAVAKRFYAYAAHRPHLEARQGTSPTLVDFSQKLQAGSVISVLRTAVLPALLARQEEAVLKGADPAVLLDLSENMALQSSEMNMFVYQCKQLRPAYLRSINRLWLHHTAIDDTCAAAIGELILACENLRELQINSTKIGRKGLNTIGKAVEQQHASASEHGAFVFFLNAMNVACSREAVVRFWAKHDGHLHLRYAGRQTSTTQPPPILLAGGTAGASSSPPQGFTEQSRQHHSRKKGTDTFKRADRDGVRAPNAASVAMHVAKGRNWEGTLADDESKGGGGGAAGTKAGNGGVVNEVLEQQAAEARLLADPSLYMLDAGEGTVHDAYGSYDNASDMSHVFATQEGQLLDGNLKAHQMMQLRRHMFQRRPKIGDKNNQSPSPTKSYEEQVDDETEELIAVLGLKDEEKRRQGVQRTRPKPQRARHKASQGQQQTPKLTRRQPQGGHRDIHGHIIPSSQAPSKGATRRSPPQIAGSQSEPKLRTVTKAVSAATKAGLRWEAAKRAGSKYQ